VKRGDDQAKIKKGYRNLARQFHPDNQATGEEWKFLKVKDAYDILSDPDKKKIYDAGLALEDMMSPKSRKKVRYSPFDYIPPQRCGDIFVEAEEKLGLYFVKKIMAWHQITKNGKILETRWSNNQVKMDWV
jgi:DnaJ-class molecular chaperone